MQQGSRLHKNGDRSKAWFSICNYQLAENISIEDYLFKSTNIDISLAVVPSLFT